MGRDGKSLFVLGGSGQVGGAVIREAGRRNVSCCGTYFRHGYPGLVYWDGDIGSLEKLIEENDPQAVVYALGMTHVDDCETSREETFRWNSVVPAEIARLCGGSRAFVYFSTEYVFDGENGPYSENDPPNPLSVYGYSKLRGEQSVFLAKPDALVLRTTVVYGPEEQKKNFIFSLRKRINKKQRVMVPCDQVSSPTYNADLASAVLDLINGNKTGVWNAAGPEVMDRYSFALLAAEVFDLDKDLIIPVHTEELHQAAKRPLNAGLRIDKLQSFVGVGCMRTPREGLLVFRAGEKE